MIFSNLCSLSAIVNSIGLMMDIIGVIFVFIYGLPNPLVHAGDYFAKEPTVIEKKELEKFSRYSRVGLVLLILGFAFQLVSNFLSS
jgi:hypothetical protein